MSDWVDVYIDNSGLENANTEPPFVKTDDKPYSGKELTLAEKIKTVIRECARKEESYFTEENFKKLRFILVNEFCFNDIKGLSNRRGTEKYEYFIFMDKDAYDLDDSNFNNKIVHELAHFLFKLQGRFFNNKEEEQKEACTLVEKWGF